ncbi:hypothetical protein ACH5RR_023934 [Cinchona calisaya]|uniref:Growth-regulating factor n=1 Tax=Cinchona calisaya TaxID=153742 RepID=A0ABD2ZC11_9GENT
MQPQFLSVHGKGVISREEIKKEREGSPLSNLELGIGSSSVEKEEKDHKFVVVFTAEQFQELLLQVLIFRYLYSGLPVPIELVLPLWKSVASSLDSSKSFLGFTGQDFDYRSMMDPEPGRCRRTDGKKWRCYRDVVPNQKYCEKHMHRGCQRSRKHVETSEDAKNSNTSAMNYDNFASSVVSSDATASDSRISTSVSTSLNLTVPYSNISNTVPGTYNSGSVFYTLNGNWESKGNNVVGLQNGTTTSSLIRVLAEKNHTKYRSNCADGKGFNCTHFNANKIESSSLGYKNFCDASVVPGFGLSPKRVLQCGTATGCSRFNLDYKTQVETEPLRCRRTDGKRWRCSRDVVRDRKYCENHLNRGAKRVKMDPKRLIVAPVTPPSRQYDACGTPTVVEKLNTNLSISIAASPRKASDADCISFSNSDATTVTDEHVTSSQILTLSP